MWSLSSHLNLPVTFPAFHCGLDHLESPGQLFSLVTTHKVLTTGKDSCMCVYQNLTCTTTNYLPLARIHLYIRTSHVDNTNCLPLARIHLCVYIRTSPVRQHKLLTTGKDSFICIYQNLTYLKYSFNGSFSHSKI